MNESTVYTLGQQVCIATDLHSIPSNAQNITKIDLTQYPLGIRINSYNSYKPDFLLDFATKYRKVVKSAQDTYSQKLTAPFTDSTGQVWNGGYNTQSSLSQRSLSASLAGMSSFMFYDINNQPVSLTIDQANTIVKEMEIAYQQLFANLQTFKNEATLYATLQYWQPEFTYSPSINLKVMDDYGHIWNQFNNESTGVSGNNPTIFPPEPNNSSFVYDNTVVWSFDQPYTQVLSSLETLVAAL